MKLDEPIPQENSLPPIPFWLSLLIPMLLGCSSSIQELALPEVSHGRVDQRTFHDAVPQSPVQSFFEFSIDPHTLTVELTPLRHLADHCDTKGRPVAIDVTDAFASATFGCPNCIQIVGIAIGPTAESVELTFELSHPFPAADPGQPISNANRNDLFLNNVRLFLMTDGTATAFGVDRRRFDHYWWHFSDRPSRGFPDYRMQFVPSPPDVAADTFPFVVFETGDNFANPTGNFSSVNGWTENLENPSGFNVLGQGQSAQTTMGLDLSLGPR